MAKLTSPTQAAILAKYLADNNIKPKEEVIIDNNEPQKTNDYGLAGVKDFGIYIGSINNTQPKKIMTDEEVIPIILAHYDSVLTQIIKPEFRNNLERIKNFLYLQKVSDGICYYSRVMLGVDVCESWWIKQGKKGATLMWAKTPKFCETAEATIKSISIRVEKLTEILNSIKDNAKTI